jgi:hypothetical protein
MKSWTGARALADCGESDTLPEWKKDSIAPFITNDQAAYDRIAAACEDVSRASNQLCAIS